MNGQRPDLAAIRQRWEATLPGEWHALQTARVQHFREHGGQWWVYCDESPMLGYQGPPISEATAQFVAHAHSDIPALLAYIERWEAAAVGASSHVARLAQRAEAFRDALFLALDGLLRGVAHSEPMRQLHSEQIEAVQWALGQLGGWPFDHGQDALDQARRRVREAMRR